MSKHMSKQISKHWENSPGDRIRQHAWCNDNVDRWVFKTLLLPQSFVVAVIVVVVVVVVF